MNSHKRFYKTSKNSNLQTNIRRQIQIRKRYQRFKFQNESRGIVTAGMEQTSETKKHKHKFEIMKFNWLRNKPSNFNDSWFMKFCPKGHRNLVIAKDCATYTYSKLGKLQWKFLSLLPGGSSETAGKKVTVLDCIWNKEKKTFYILDVLFWANHNLAESETEMRFFWLYCKMQELPELSVSSENNVYKFEYVPHQECYYLILETCLTKYPCYENNVPEIDGLLFYYKEGNYSSDQSIPTGWLKPYMVPEILDIPIAVEYLYKMPENYTNLQEYIQEVEYECNNNTDQKKYTADMDMLASLINTIL